MQGERRVSDRERMGGDGIKIYFQIVFASFLMREQAYDAIRKEWLNLKVYPYSLADVSPLLCLSSPPTPEKL
jgi:hypothetical protein